LAITIERTVRVVPMSASSEYGSTKVAPVQIRAIDLSSNQTVALFDDLMTRGIVEGASDIHIESGAREGLVRFRVDGMLYDVMKLDPQMTTPLLALLKTRAEMLAHEKRRPQDGRFSYEADNNRIDVRVVTIPVIGGDNLEQAVMRLQDPHRALMGLTDLGMTQADYDRYVLGIDQPYGFALVSGPTGSGKTTTLYASLQMVVHADVKVMSVEDPVELQIKGVMQIEIPRAGEDRWGFAEILPSIVRSDPNIIMVGEIRDPQTANMALNASLTGHYVYSTLHANNAVTTIIRLGELGVEPFLIAEALEVVVAQRLIRRVCDCGEPYQPTLDELKSHRVPDIALERYEQGEEIPMLVRRSERGCAKCGGRGYRGRTGLFELLIVTDEMRQAVLRRADMLEMRQLARDTGMKTLREDGWIKVLSGATTLEELNREIKRDVH
jgi:type IV pilus assembly protein PilB